MNPLFDWLKDSGTQAILVLVGTIAACIAAVAGVFAAKYAKAAPTKGDLKRVEDHVAATSGHLFNQARRDELMVIASKVSITVTGRDYEDEGLNVHLAVGDLDVKLSRIYLYSESGTSYGSAACVQEGAHRYTAAIQQNIVPRWYRAVAGDQSSTGMFVRLKLRVYMNLQDGAAYKEMPVTLGNIRVADTRTEAAYGNVISQAWEIHGEA